MSRLEGKRIGFCMTGSFCTFSRVLDELDSLCATGAQVQGILSENAYSLDTRFLPAAEVRSRVERATGREIWHTLGQVEPIGPKGLLDLVIVAPATGNTLGKLAAGIIDTPVAMAVKSHLRNNRPVLLAVSTNDGLSGCAPNIGRLLGMRNLYFVPFGQDAPFQKPASLVAHFERIQAAAESALRGEQLQPLLVQSPAPAREAPIS